MKYVLWPVAFPIAAVIAVITLVMLAALFAVHAAFGYEHPVIDE